MFQMKPNKGVNVEVKDNSLANWRKPEELLKFVEPGTEDFPFDVRANLAFLEGVDEPCLIIEPNRDTMN